MVSLDRFDPHCRVPDDPRRHPHPQRHLVRVHQLQRRGSKATPQAQQEQVEVKQSENLIGSCFGVAVKLLLEKCGLKKSKKV